MAPEMFGGVADVLHLELTNIGIMVLLGIQYMQVGFYCLYLAVSAFHFLTIFELFVLLFPAPGIDQHCNSGPACWEHNMQVRCCLLPMDCFVISFDLKLGWGLKI